MVKGIESKNVLVTGAAQGIGFAVARRFAEEGASVFIVDRAETAQMAAALENIRSVAKTVRHWSLGIKPTFLMKRR
jgi:NAD(P)-dependent dehydrogenase (short-subunit alcohol dehydrogenase family)